jgi:multidrug transporter EmrE-like cation transporter
VKWIVPFSLLMLFEIIGSFFSGLFGSTQNFLLVPLALAVYTLANYFWLQALNKGSGLARGTIYFGVIFVITTISIGFIFYEEAIDLIKLFGIGTGVTSIILLADDLKH